MFSVCLLSHTHTCFRLHNTHSFIPISLGFLSGCHCFVYDVCTVCIAFSDMYIFTVTIVNLKHLIYITEQYYPMKDLNITSSAAKGAFMREEIIVLYKEGHNPHHTPTHEAIWVPRRNCLMLLIEKAKLCVYPLAF